MNNHCKTDFLSEWQESRDKWTRGRLYTAQEIADSNEIIDSIKIRELFELLFGLDYPIEYHEEDPEDTEFWSSLWRDFHYEEFKESFHKK